MTEKTASFESFIKIVQHHYSWKDIVLRVEEDNIKKKYFKRD